MNTQEINEALSTGEAVDDGAERIVADDEFAWLDEGLRRGHRGARAKRMRASSPSLAIQASWNDLAQTAGFGLSNALATGRGVT